MPRRHHERIPPTDDWRQLELLNETPDQRSYEAIRPLLLLGSITAGHRKCTSAIRAAGAPAASMWRVGRLLATAPPGAP